MSANIHMSVNKMTYKNQYDKLKEHEKYIVYYYWQFIETDGKKGWDVYRSGCRDHWRYCREIQQHYDTARSFYCRAKVRSIVRNVVEANDILRI